MKLKEKKFLIKVYIILFYMFVDKRHKIEILKREYDEISN
jgi:hypothetical protein